MAYYIDLEQISIDEYRNSLETGYLPPSRMILKENLDERFPYFKGVGIDNIKSLMQLLKKKDQITELQKMHFFAGDYLKILLRELNSILPKPNKLAEFTSIPQSVITLLEQKGIKHTLSLYNHIVTQEQRKALALSTGIEEHELLKLTKLTDLSRIKWVGAKFAQMLFDIGVDTVKKASEADPVDLHEKINALNAQHNIYKGHIGLNDIKIFVDAAKKVPQDIEF